MEGRALGGTRPDVLFGRGAPETDGRWRLELWWIPLGAGAHVVRISGRLYERLLATLGRRTPQDLYHSALIALTPAGRITIEMTPVPPPGGPDRGVVAGGPVGSRLLGRLRLFRYEVRRWPDGEIPDLPCAVASPVALTEDATAVASLLDAVARVPTLVWGRDELGVGDMWNSNSVVSWSLATAGLLDRAGAPPTGGRAPGWDAGVAAADGASAGVRHRVGGRGRSPVGR